MSQIFRFVPVLVLACATCPALCQQDAPSPSQAPIGIDKSCYAVTGAGSLLSTFDGKTLNLTGVQNLAIGLVMGLTDPAGRACQSAASYPAWRASVATNQTLSQNGASSSSPGTTSAVEKSGIPALLAIALENGAIRDNVSGNTMTLTTTPMAFLEAFLGVENGNCPSLICRQLGVSATFNVTSGSSIDPSQATRRNISQWQLKYSFQDTSEYSGRANSAFEKYLRAPLQGLANSLSATEMNDLAEVDSRIVAIITPGFVQSVISASSGGQTTVFNTLTPDQQEVAAAKLLQAVATDTLLQNVVLNASTVRPLQDALARALSARAAVGAAYLDYKKALAAAKPRWNGAVTFNQQYPTTSVTTTSGTTKTQPTYLAPGIIVSFDPTAATAKAKPASSPLWTPSVTLNAGGSFYPNPLPTANEATFRGATTALQAQWSLGKGPFLKDPNDKGQITFSLNGNYSRLQENQHQAGKKADIAVGNIKWEVPLPGGITFPLSFTVANATNQVKETYVRGNFGITFDLDKLQSLLKAAH